MKNLKIYSLVLSLLFYVIASAQLEVDHPIQLTGSGANAKISGIQSITNTQDAVSAGAIQNGTLVYATATGSNNSFLLNISPAISQYQAGMAFNFISNQNVNGPATLNVNGLGSKPIKKNVNHDLSGCEILNNQIVTVVYDGTNFQITSNFGSTAALPNAGSDQLNKVDTILTLAANNPTSGTGAWSVLSGQGGSFSNALSPTSNFSGNGGTTYTLAWTITSFCSVLSDTVIVSFQPSGSHTFNYTGGQQLFTVPANVSQINVDVYGAQGGTVGGNAGGLGGYAHGSLGVTPGQVLYIYVGGHPGSSTGGFNGGGNGYGGSTGGGGGSDIRTNGTGLSNRVIVGGGGGGATSSWTTSGGSGGGLFGGAGTSSNGTTQAGQGASQNAGGQPETTYNTGTAGTLGQGGIGAYNNGDDGGGGGGYYGGGGGGAGGGGGGSGYVGGVTNGTMQSGVQTGNGQIILTW